LHEPQLLPRPPNLGVHLEENVDPFAWDAAPHVQQKRLATVAVSIGWPWGELRRRAVWGMDQSPSLGKSESEDLVTDRECAMEYDRGPLETVEGATGHGPEPLRPAVALRFQHAPERVQVMAEDARTTSGKFQQQLRITVIDEVEGVEPRG
jgi:hypothetical protein